MSQKRSLPVYCLAHDRGLVKMYEPAIKTCFFIPSFIQPRYAPIRIIEQEDSTRSDSHFSPQRPINTDIATKLPFDEFKASTVVTKKPEAKSLDDHLAFIFDSMKRPKKGEVCNNVCGRTYEKLKRKRKTELQSKLLQSEYSSRKGKISRQDAETVATKLGLRSGQVYKWFWDQQQKNEKHKKKINSL